MRVFDDLTDLAPVEANMRAFAELQTFKIPIAPYSVCGYTLNGCVAGCFGILYFPDNLNRTFVFRRQATEWVIASSVEHEGLRQWRFNAYETVRAFCDEVMGWYGRPAKCACCPGIVRLKTLQLLS